MGWSIPRPSAAVGHRPPADGRWRRSVRIPVLCCAGQLRAVHAGGGAGSGGASQVVAGGAPVPRGSSGPRREMKRGSQPLFILSAFWPQPCTARRAVRDSARRRRLPAKLQLMHCGNRHGTPPCQDGTARAASGTARGPTPLANGTAQCRCSAGFPKSNLNTAQLFVDRHIFRVMALSVFPHRGSFFGRARPVRP